MVVADASVVKGEGGGVSAALLCALLLAAACAPSAVRAGRRAMARGDYDEATEQFEVAAQADPDDAARWRDLARAELLADRPAGARRAFARMAALMPGDPHPVVEIGFAHELERNYDRALESYLRAVRTSPESAYAYRVLGTRLLRWGRADEALGPLQRSLELEAHAETFKALALARHGAGDRTGAIEAYEWGLETFTAHLGLRLGLAALLVNDGAFARALAVYEGISQDVPGFAAAHAGRAILLHELGREDEAEAAFERAAEVADGQGDYAERLETYRRLRADSAEAQTPR
ncbi:MAG: tetratricopeptide repeat protein [Myxococcota bacterium]